MGKIVGVIALLAFGAFGAYQAFFSEKSTSISVVQARTPLKDVARIEQGLRVDRTLPDGQIWPWDNQPVQTWMDREIARLDPLVTDPIYRAMAETQTLTSDSDTGESLGLYYQETYDAIGFIYDGDDSMQNAGLYVLLHTAKANDAWAYHNLSNWLHDTQNAPEDMIHALAREAADLEFLPAIVNVVVDWEQGTATTPAERTAYLKYGYDLGVADGRWNVANAIAYYHIYQAPDIPSDGYLDLALTTLRDEYGEIVRYHEDQGFRLDDGIDGPLDKAGAYREYIASVEAGGTWALNRIGYKFMGGAERGVPYDKDKARDYFHACLVIDPRDTCALNLGSLYYTPSRNSVDYAVAHAFYRFGSEMNGEHRGTMLDEIQEILPNMSADDIKRANEYYEAINLGDFSEIPHVKDARPVLQ